MNYQPLHSTNAATVKPSSSKFDWKQIRRSIKQLLSLNTELQVWQELDHKEHGAWSAYDPETKQSIRHVSEQQMRIWIEQRSHR